MLAAAGLVEEVAGLVAVRRPAGLPPEETERRFQAALGQALATVTPTFLLLDNQDDEGRLLDTALGGALVDLGVVGGAGFRVIATSRRALRLPPGPPFEPTNLDLGELPPSGCRKLRPLDRDGLGSLDEPAW